jgi:hypothetical protein
MTRNQTETNPIQPTLGELERTLISEYLRGRGHDRKTIEALPEPERHALLTEASTYASARLTEIESRSHFVHDIHGTSGAGS